MASQWPLHAKPVSPLSWDVVKSFHVPELQFLWDAKLYEYDDSLLCSMPDSGRNMTKEQFDELVSKELFEWCDRPPRYVGSYIFTHPEESKLRLRVVHDTLFANIAAKNVDPVQFTPLHKFLGTLRNVSFAYTCDFAAFYYQFPVHPSIRGFFTARVGEKFIRPTRLPMGFVHGAKMAQGVTCEILRNAISSQLVNDAYIDGVAVAGVDEAAVAQSRHLFLVACNTVGIQLSEDSGVVTQFTHRGVTIDLATKKFRLSSKFMEKFRVRISMFDDNGKQTWGLFRSTIGMILHSFLIFQEPIASIAPLMRFCVRHLTTYPSSTVTIWPSARPAWKHAEKCILQNAWRDLPTLFSPDGIIITDASTACETGGAVVIFDGSVHAVSFALPVEKIHLMEADALIEALAFARTVSKTANWLILMDNTTALYAFANGYSMSFELNERVKRLLVVADGCRLAYAYIPTKANPADQLSRCAEVFVLAPHQTDFLVHAFGEFGWRW